jgi:hypothetical protein
MVLIMAGSAHAQVQDSLSITLPTDTTNVSAQDSIATNDSDDLGLDYEVEYFGKDSTVVDVVNQRIMMYGGAWVKYGSMEVKGEYIDFSLKDFTAKAVGKRDSTGAIVQKAVFTEGDMAFDEDSLMYNFNTKRGISYGVFTKLDDAYLHAGVSKKSANDWISLRNGKFTTCDKPNPHYHFHLTKAVQVPNDKIVSGPLYMKFRKIPTPLALPFGFFPNRKESTHGILIPGYGNGGTKGYFFQNLGYYLPLGQYLDTKFLFDVYTRGSWSAKNITRYNKLYKYNGSFNISRTINLDGMPELPSTYNKQTTFNIQWTHNQDAKARPNTSFGASVNLGSSQNFRNNLNSSQTNYLSSTFTSQIRWTRDFVDTPFNIGVNFGHTQNTQTRQVDVTLPSFTANMKRIMLGKFVSTGSPFKRMLDNVGIQGSANLSNRVTAHESLYSFSNINELMNRSRNGIQVQGSASTAGTIMKYITTTANLSGTYYGSIKEVRLNQIEGAAPVTDTVFNYINGFNYRASTDLNTRFYGMFNFRKGNLRAIRHVIMPSAGFSYTPYSNYKESYINDQGNLVAYSPFDVAAYVPQSNIQGMNLNFSVRQSIEAKVRDKNATKANATKKVMLLDNWNMGSSYNFFADSLRLGGLTMGASTSIMNKFKVSYNSNYSFYDRDERGREIDRYLINSGNRLMRMRSTAVALSFGLKSKERNRLNRADEGRTKEEHALLAESKGALVDLSVPWNLNVSYTMNFSNQLNLLSQRDSLVTRQGVMFNGSVTLFKYWAFTFNSGYDMSHLKADNLSHRDLAMKYFTPTTLGLTWDLHCWEFTASYVPFGMRKSYMFQINIKSAMLQDLKFQRRGNLGDADLLY